MSVLISRFASLPSSHRSLLRCAQGYIYALLAASAFGFIPLFSIPVLQAGMHTSSVLIYRMGLSSVLTLAVILVRRQSLRIGLRQAGALAGLAFFYTLSSLFLLESYLYIPSGVATTIHFLYPVFVTLTAALFFGEKLSPGSLLAALLSLCGVALLSAGTLGHLLDGSLEREKALIGIGLVLITVVGYGSYLLFYSRPLIRQLDSAVSTFYVLLLTTLFCSLALLLRGEEGLQAVPDWATAVNLLLLSTIPTLCSNLLLVLAIRRVGSTPTSVLGCMEPLTAVVLGVAFLGETLSALQTAGIFTVLAAVAWTILSRRQAPGRNPPPPELPNPDIPLSYS